MGETAHFSRDKGLSNAPHAAKQDAPNHMILPENLPN